MHFNEDLKLTGHYRFTIRDAATGAIKRVHEYKNLIPLAFRASIIDNMTNPSPSSGLLFNYIALGSSTTAPASGDTTLGTETYRNAVASLTGASNVGYVTGFFDATEVTGTFKEAGIFADGTSSADTGTLASHVAIDVTKTDTETLTVDFTITQS